MVRNKSSVGYILSLMLLIFCAQTTLSASGSVLLLDTVKDILGSALATDYRTAQEFVLEAPGSGYEVYIPLFPASGDALAPFQEVPVTLRAIKNTPPVIQEIPTILALAKICAQDVLIQKSKQSPLFAWLSDQKLNPCKLFFLKMILLAKDFCTQGDVAYVQREAVRLIIRLSLTENNGITDPSKPLSSYLPSDLVDLISLTCPAILEIMDSFWKTLISATNEGDITQALTHSRSFVGVVLGDATEASILFKALNHYTGPSFTQCLEALLTDNGFAAEEFKKFRIALKYIDQNPWAQKLYAHQNFYNIEPTNIPASMPAEIVQAIFTAPTLPHTVMVTVDNQTWIGQVSSTLSVTQTIKLTGVTLLTTLKKYVAARTAYFATHPAEAKAYAQAKVAREQQTKMVKAFCTTEHGQASIERLNQSLLAINDAAQQPQIVDCAALEAQNAAISAQLATLNEKIQKSNNQLISLKKAHALASPTAAVKLNKSISAIEADLTALQQERSTLEAQQLKTSAQLNIAHPSIYESDQANIAERKKLENLVHVIQQNGLEVPSYITKRIQELQKNCVAAPQQQVIAQPDQIVQQAQHMAAAFQQEAKIIRQELKQRSAATTLLPANSEERMMFELVTQAQYKAYITHLEQEAENTTVSHTFLHNIFGSSIEFNTLLKDFGSNNVTFAAIKNELTNKLTMIAQHSPLLQEHNVMFNQIIALYLPELASLLQEITQASQHALFGV